MLPDGLEITLSVQNCSERTMPAMLGLHPYFPQPASATVQARARTVWLTDAQALPVQEVMTPPDWSFDRARRVTRVELSTRRRGRTFSASSRRRAVLVHCTAMMRPSHAWPRVRVWL